MTNVASLPRLLFISPRFLFPMESGGQIRSGQILRHLHDRHFKITLLSPATAGLERRYAETIKSICANFISYRRQPRPSWQSQLSRAAALWAPLPVSVVSDVSVELQNLIAAELRREYEIVVYDFIHAAANFIPYASPTQIVFTHNVEHEIYKRQAEMSQPFWRHALWQAQYKKMRAFETAALSWFDRIIAVSEKDRDYFQRQNPAWDIKVIPTGVDLEYFRYRAPQRAPEIVFVGSMDYAANIEGIGWFLRQVWGRLKRKHPAATVKIIGRYPPASLLKEFAHDCQIRFTGRVDEVYREARSGGVYIVPLRVGSGTRIKIFEAMAMGIPMVSTRIGVEGLPVTPNEHYLEADAPQDFADAVDVLLSDPVLSRRLSQQARRLVEENYSWEKVAAVFAQCCRLPSVSRNGRAKEETTSHHLAKSQPKEKSNVSAKLTTH